MRWYNSIKIKLIGFFLVVSVVFLVTMLSVLNLLKEDSLHNNASKEVSLATIEILNNLENKKYRLEEIVLALASVSQDITTAKDKKKIVKNILKANNSGLITSGGIWFEPYSIESNKSQYNYFFNRKSEHEFTLIEDYSQKSTLNYHQTEFYLVAKYLKKGETYWTKVYNDPVTKVRMVTVVAPIYKKKQFIGVATLDVRVKESSSKIFDNFKFSNRYLMMVDREGTFIIKSTLLENYMKSEKLFYPKCNILTANFKELESLFKKCDISNEYNKSIATALHKQSPEISKEESQRIASILAQSGEDRTLQENIHFVTYDPILKQESIVAIFHFPLTHWKIIIGIPKAQVLNESNAMYNKIIDASIYLTLLATLIGYFLLRNIFVNPIENINRQLYNNRIQKDKHYQPLKCNDKGEIGRLVINLNARTNALRLSQDREEQEIKKRVINEELLEQQSKMAAMGGMMDSVAHQWKQPLNALSMYSEIIKSDFEDGDVDQKYIEEFRDNIQLQIKHMLTTLDEFRTFFRPNKEEEHFELLDAINSVLFLTKDEFMKNSIVVEILHTDMIDIFGFKNEFKHLILNIINNSKDAFNDNNITKRVIEISLINQENDTRLEIKDNAGGIPDSVLDTLFDANVTTKEKGKGTGIGLFMSMQIATKHGAKLSVHNEKEGACFVVEFNKLQPTPRG